MIQNRPQNGLDIKSNLHNLTPNGGFKFNTDYRFLELQTIPPSFNVDRPDNCIHDVFFCNLWALGNPYVPGYKALFNRQGQLAFQGTSNGNDLRVINVGTRFIHDNRQLTNYGFSVRFRDQEVPANHYITAVMTFELSRDCAELDVTVFPRNRNFGHTTGSETVFSTNRKLRYGEGYGSKRNLFDVVTIVRFHDQIDELADLRDVVEAGFTVRAPAQANVNYKVMNFREILGPYERIPELTARNEYDELAEIEKAESVLGIRRPCCAEYVALQPAVGGNLPPSLSALTDPSNGFTEGGFLYSLNLTGNSSANFGGGLVPTFTVWNETTTQIPTDFDNLPIVDDTLISIELQIEVGISVNNITIQTNPPMGDPAQTLYIVGGTTRGYIPRIDFNGTPFATTTSALERSVYYKPPAGGYALEGSNFDFSMVISETKTMYVRLPYIRGQSLDQLELWGNGNPGSGDTVGLTNTLIMIETCAGPDVLPGHTINTGSFSASVDFDVLVTGVGFWRSNRNYTNNRTPC